MFSRNLISQKQRHVGDSVLQQEEEIMYTGYILSKQASSTCFKVAFTLVFGMTEEHSSS